LEQNISVLEDNPKTRPWFSYFLAKGLNLNIGIGMKLVLTGGLNICTFQVGTCSKPTTTIFYLTC
jgi:hypothetical protein